MLERIYSSRNSHTQLARIWMFTAIWKIVWHYYWSWTNVYSVTKHLCSWLDVSQNCMHLCIQCRHSRFIGSIIQKSSKLDTTQMLIVEYLWHIDAMEYFIVIKWISYSDTQGCFYRLISNKISSQRRCKITHIILFIKMF